MSCMNHERRIGTGDGWMWMFGNTLCRYYAGTMQVLDLLMGKKVSSQVKNTTDDWSDLNGLGVTTFIYVEWIWVGNVEFLEDLSSFKNQPQDFEAMNFDPIKACNDVMKAWASDTSLLPAMRPSVYIPMESLPQGQTKKTTHRPTCWAATKVLVTVSSLLISTEGGLVCA